jgi:hypothetical protein
MAQKVSISFGKGKVLLYRQKERTASFRDRNGTLLDPCEVDPALNTQTALHLLSKKFPSCFSKATSNEVNKLIIANNDLSRKVAEKDLKIVQLQDTIEQLFRGCSHVIKQASEEDIDAFRLQERKKRVRDE